MPAACPSARARTPPTEVSPHGVRHRFRVIEDVHAACAVRDRIRARVARIGQSRAGWKRTSIDMRKPLLRLSSVACRPRVLKMITSPSR